MYSGTNTCVGVRVILYVLCMFTGYVEGTPCTILTGSGTLRSPNYPNNYDNDLDICWILRGDDDNVSVELLSVENIFSHGNDIRNYVTQNTGLRKSVFTHCIKTHDCG